ncbi:hypothetical protein [Microscilla marina]|uniref:Uncharacterized protein n=1 Tax=Microscilla marina ATCC 23134 TaxID=313606 RepID=A1ZFF1_MICM2|nr:hypothetical protein [Microscilla marina]EAY30725.1 hypothetical protein M23134_01049 [Microscilla marina ATCC 23134]
MMNKYFYSDKIENYILGNLSESEKIAFEELIEQDPVLKNELDLQQETIQSMQDQRKAQLKHRLNNIQVEPVSYSLSRINLLESVLLVSIVATTITLFALFYGTKSNISAEKAAPASYYNELSFVPYIKLKHTPVAEQHKKEKVVIATIPSISRITQTPQHNYQNALLKKIKQEQQLKKKNTPREIEARKEESSGSSAAVPQNKELLYQYYNDGLFLTNSESKGYQIPLESHGITKHYLYYQGKVYELKPNQVEPVPPKQVTDQKIIDQVKKRKQMFFGGD